MSARRSKLDWMKDLYGADLTHAEFRVLVVFLIHSNASRDNAFLGRKTLAVEAVVNEKTARTAVKSLRSKGWLVRTDEGGNQHWKGKADVYSIRTPDVASCTKGGSETRKGGV